MIELRKLTYDERAVWGVCPVCGAKPGKPCIKMTTDWKPSKLLQAKGAHMARLVNAPETAAQEKP